MHLRYVLWVADKAFVVRTDRAFVMSAEKISAVSADRTAVVSQDINFKANLGKVDHMTDCAWIGPAVIIRFFLQVILGTVGHVSMIDPSWFPLDPGVGVAK